MEKVCRAGSEACETNYRPHIFTYFLPGTGGKHGKVQGP